VYTVEETAKILKLDVSQVRNLLRSGKIEGKKWGRDWMVLSLDYTRRRKPGGGRKPKERNDNNES
jgi:excisionase family DNA binding protein